MKTNHSPIFAATAALMLAAVFAPWVSGAAAPADALARQTIAWGGRERGVALVADGGSLAAALVASSSFVVVDQQPDETARTRVAAAADQAGTLGRRHYVAIGSPTACVLADGYADLVVVGRATDAMLTPAMAQELARVTAPYGGTLVVGNPDATAGLTRAALETWAARLGEKAEIKSEGGLWAVWKRPALPGGDDWSHWYYDAGGNPASRDTALTYPFELAWTAKPMQATRTETRVAAAGRLFTLMRPHQREGMFQTHRFEGGDEVIARSLANGEILWRFPLGDDAYAMRSSLIATPETLFVMRRERVLVLDPQTGQERPPLALADAAGEVKSIWLRDGVLLALVGSTRDLPEFCPTANVAQSIGKFKTITAEAGYGFGDTLVAWDLAAGKERWRWKAPSPIDCRTVGVSPGGTVLAHTKGDAVYGLALADGKERWRQQDPAVLDLLAKLDPSEHWGYNMVSRPGLTMTDEVALLAHAGSAELVVLSTADGSLLWHAARGRTFPVQAVVLGDRVASVSLSAGTWLDARSGKSALESPDARMSLSGANHPSCGQVTATGRYVMGCSGGPLFDIETRSPLMPIMAKAECAIGNAVAGGTFFQLPGACSGCNRIMGFLAMRSFSKIDLRVPADAPGRLTPGEGAPGPTAPPDGRDWPTRRHDAARSGGTDVAVAASGAIRWRWTPRAPYPPTADNIASMLPLGPELRLAQPVSAGDLVVVAGGEGTVTALDRATGKERWRALLGGRIHGSPSIEGGRVFAGCTDGTVTALSAADGRLIWRYRIAPSDRRVMSYGHLESMWPVVCSPLVAGDTVYAAAGRPMTPGGYIAALDVATGKPRWLESYVPYSGDEIPAGDRMRLPDPAAAWVVPYGELALQGDLLVVRTRGSTGYAGLLLDRRTGRRATGQSIYDHDLSYGRLQGGETGVLPGGMIWGGGWEIDLDQNASSYRLAELGAAVVDDDGTLRASSIAEKGGWLRANEHPPVWNGKILAGPGFGARGMRAYDLAAWQDAIRPQLKAKPPYGYTTKLELPPLWGPIAPDTAEPVINKYGKTGVAVMGFALGADAVVCASRKQAPIEDGPFKGESVKLAKIIGGQIAAFDAATGALRWTVDLPSAPAHDAVALDRDGNTLVGLQDGGVASIGQPEP